MARSKKPTPELTTDAWLKVLEELKPADDGDGRTVRELLAAFGMDEDSMHGAGVIRRWLRRWIREGRVQAGTGHRTGIDGRRQVVPVYKVVTP